MPSRLPLPLKAAYTLWFILWVPAYWHANGPANFLWLCDVANFVLLVALWRESPLLFSSQAVGIVLIQAVWAFDFLARLATGTHPIGGTEYMFDPADPLWLRSCSLFHLWTVPLVLWAVRRLGYDRRALALQSALTAAVLPASFLAGTPAQNLNWLWEPFGVPQTWMPPWAWLLFSIAAYPLVLYWPAHALLRRWAARG